MELAKEIAKGAIKGRIVTRDGRSVRIVCWDAQRDDNIVALIRDEKGVEFTKDYTSDGRVFLMGKSSLDLMLEIPEYMTFKDGDEFNPFDRVLVRDSNEEHWAISLFARKLIDISDGLVYKYECSNGTTWNYCIPYNEQTAHLLGTTEDYVGTKQKENG